MGYVPELAAAGTAVAIREGLFLSCPSFQAINTLVAFRIACKLVCFVLIHGLPAELRLICDPDKFNLVENKVHTFLQSISRLFNPAMIERIDSRLEFLEDLHAASKLPGKFQPQRVS